MKVRKYLIEESLNPERVDNLKEAIGRHKGINAMHFDLLANTLTVNYDGGIYSAKDIRDFINNTGLKFRVVKPYGKFFLENPTEAID